MKVKCDKCGGPCSSYLREPIKEPEPISMDEFINNQGKVGIVNTVMVYHQYVLKCDFCGFSKEYTA